MDQIVKTEVEPASQDWFYTDAPRNTLQHACGKAILVGEHAVVYGADAVAMPVKSQRIQFCLDPKLKSQDQSSQLILNGKRAPKEIESVINDAFVALGLKPFPIVLEGQSNLPIGAGLGSSACLCVATLRSIADSLGMELDRKQLANLANDLEKRFHGNPSGLDTAVVAYEQVVAFNRNSPIKTIGIDDIQIKRNGKLKTSKWRFVLIDSKERARTKDMITIAEPYFTGKNQTQVIEDFNDIALEATHGLSHGNPSMVANAMTRSSKHLSAAGVQTPKLDEIIADCLNAGCLAAKPTGAGGGGVVLALLDAASANASISDLMSTYGYDHVLDISLPVSN